MQSSKQTWPVITCDGQMSFQRELNGREHQDVQLTPDLPRNSKKKLRESCNNCAISKVRCSKERPICKRCEDRGTLCQFSLSRRSGKRRRVPISENGTANSNHPSSGSASPLPSELQQQPAAEIQRPLSIPQSKPQKVADTMMLWEYPFLDLDADGELDNQLDHGSSYGEGKASICPRTPLNSPDSAVHSQISMLPKPVPAPQQPFAINQPMHPSPVQGPEALSIPDFPIPCSEDCMAIILNILQVLHTAHQSCTWPSPASPFIQPHFSEIDRILVENKEAIDLVGNILRCPCSLDWQLWLVLTLVFSKLIARYGDVISNGGCSREDSKQVSYSQSMIVESPGERRAKVRPVFSELYRVSELIGKLAGRFTESQDGVPLAELVEDERSRWEDIPAREETTMVIGFETRLRNELRSVTERAMEILHKN